MQKERLLLVKTHYLNYKWLPMGLMYVAQAAENAGAEVRILDLSLEKKPFRILEKTLKDFAPALVGIGGMYCEFEEVRQIAKFVKDYLKEALVVVGGPLTAGLAKECLRDKNIDIVSFKEGESIIQDLICYINGKMELADIKGIAFRRNGELFFNASRPIEDVNAIPIPAWHLIDAFRYISTNDNWFGKENLEMLNIVPARGCPYACVFCDKNVFGQKWRGRDPKNIVDEMEMLKKDYGIKAVMFLDDIFDVNKKWVYDFIEELKRRNLGLYWGCSSRVNHADYNLYKAMYEAGCLYIFYGIEFGSDTVLKRANKQINSLQAEGAIEIAHQAGLRVVSAYMLGMLDETEEELEATIRAALNSKAEVCTITVLTPLRGTRLFELAVKAGKIDPAKPWWKATRSNAYINLTKNTSNRRLAYLVSKTYWMLFWSRPSRKLPRWLCKIMQYLFYPLSPLAGDKFINFIFCLDRLRRIMRFGLP